ncbi:hypothetical protein BDZ45DRAFT_746872 [Acephala macrosclerotiorum]|nr:hypothetical protein BDZ45DRAFT_746872 [Acephala macrosclerotiorum]
MAIQWSLQQEEEGTPLNLIMLHGLANDTWEPISRVPANTTTLNWTVGTHESLSISHAFYFQLLFDDANEPAATSHDFNITSAESPVRCPRHHLDLSTISTSSASSMALAGLMGSSLSIFPSAGALSTRTLTTASEETSTTVGTNITSSSPCEPAFKPAFSFPSEDIDNSLNTAAKIGLGLGVPILVILTLTVS